MFTLDEVKEYKEKMQEFFNKKFEEKILIARITLPFDPVAIIDYLEIFIVYKPDLYNELVAYINNVAVKDKPVEPEQITIMLKAETVNPIIGKSATEDLSPLVDSVINTSDPTYVHNGDLEKVKSTELYTSFKDLTDSFSPYIGRSIPNIINNNPYINRDILNMINNNIVSVTALKCHGKDFTPIKAHEDGDTGYDCFAFILDENKNPTSITIKPGEVKGIKLGFSQEIGNYVRTFYSDRVTTSETLAAQLRPKSGLSLKNISCALGTLDQLWNNHNLAIITNNSDKDYTFNFGDKVCQLCFEWVPLLNKNMNISVFESTDDTLLDGGSRGGFGSTGK
jgi:dUTPase